jgi:hypothetical protein
MTERKDLAGKHVVLGLSGGIACYKAADLARVLGKAGATVQVVMTAGAEAIGHAASAVAALAERFSAAAAAIALILDAPGHVVVTGLGKSGLVGAKLAATLASTGTRSFFLHAADALHGDVGSLSTGDVLIAISHSARRTKSVASPSWQPTAAYP